MIAGHDVTLYVKSVSGYDDFNAPIITETAETVHGVLIAPSSSDELRESFDMYGRRAIYTLGIPKGDTHDWENVHVEFFGHKFQTFGIPTQGVEKNIPLLWNTKVRCELIE